MTLDAPATASRPRSTAGGAPSPIAIAPTTTTTSPSAKTTNDDGAARLQPAPPPGQDHWLPATAPITWSASRPFGCSSRRSGRRAAGTFLRVPHGARGEGGGDLRRLRDTQFKAYSQEDLAYAIQYIAEEDTLAAGQRAGSAESQPLPGRRRLRQREAEQARPRDGLQEHLRAAGHERCRPGHRRRARSPGLEHRAAPLQASRDVYGGPGYTNAEAEAAIRAAGLKYEIVEPIEPKIAELLAQSFVVARFEGRVEFAPRARPSLDPVHGPGPQVNTWLNKRLQRTEFHAVRALHAVRGRGAKASRACRARITRPSS